MTTTIRRLLAPSLRVAAAVALTLAATAIPARAQAPAPASPQLAGTWRGSFVTDGPTGGMALTITVEGDTWKIDNAMEGDGVPPPSDVRDWKAEGMSFTFAQTFGEFDVLFKGTLEGDTIKGTLEAYQAGSLVGTGTYTLTRQ